MARRKILFCFSICLKISLPPANYSATHLVLELFIFSLATCIFRLSLPIDLYTIFCHSLSLSYMGIKEQSPREPVSSTTVFCPSGSVGQPPPLPPAWKVTVPSLSMVKLRMPQNMADRLASTVGSDTAAGQVTQLQHLLSPSSERRDLMSNAAYVEELYTTSTDFAQPQFRDKLNAVALLFAAQLWVSIMEHPADLEEPFAASPLSAFRSSSSTSNIGSGSVLSPFMMNDTSMTHPQCLPQHPRLSKTEQAIIWMPDLRILGLPSYRRQQAPALVIDILTLVVQLSFQGLTLPISIPEGFSNPSVNDLRVYLELSSLC
ncbi:hypothetical protein FOXYSP1_02262 [Fusarium oxysporum f. sp. phaseoli]